MARTSRLPRLYPPRNFFPQWHNKTMRRQEDVLLPPHPLDEPTRHATLLHLHPPLSSTSCLCALVPARPLLWLIVVCCRRILLSPSRLLQYALIAIFVIPGARLSSLRHHLLYPSHRQCQPSASLRSQIGYNYKAPGRQQGVAPVVRLQKKLTGEVAAMVIACIERKSEQLCVGDESQDLSDVVQNGLRTLRHCKDLQAKLAYPFTRALGGPN